MIPEQQKEATVVSVGKTADSIKMSLDLDSAQMLMQMLSKNLYSDSVGSTIRECASNALDSHRRTGVSDPIIVSLGFNETTNGFEFSVEDFGTGLDADDVENIISKYGKSTKRNSKDELGMMGLGFKAPLAYSNTFYFVARKDGVERKYMMYEGEDTNTIDLLYETPTDQRNGVKVIVPVNFVDRYLFANKIKEQLAYFENVYFNVNVNGITVNNDFKILRNDIFQYSEINSDDKLHICLDNVYYPIDFSKLEISPIHVKVGLRLSLTDGVFPTPNREAIRYTQEAKKKILSKIEDLSTFCIKQYNDTYNESEDLVGVFKCLEEGTKMIDITPNFSINAMGLEPFSKIAAKKPSIKNVNKYLDIMQVYKYRNTILSNYARKHLVDQSSFKNIKADNWRYRFNLNSLGREKWFRFDEHISVTKRAFLRHYFNELYGNSYFTVNLMKKTHEMKLGNYSSNNRTTYYEILGLSKVPKKKWREVISDFQKLINGYINSLPSIDDIEISEAWLEAQKKTRAVKTAAARSSKAVGELVCKKLDTTERESNLKTYKTVSHYIKSNDIKDLIVYTVHNNVNDFNGIFKLCLKNNVSLVTFSDRELKIAEKLKLDNLISLEEFMKGKTRQFKRMATAILIDQLTVDFRETFMRTDALENIDTDFYTKLNKLANYRQKHYLSIPPEGKKAILEVAEQHSYYDFSIYSDYTYIKEKLEKFYFIEELLKNAHPARYKSQEYQRCIIDLLKYNKHKVNLQNYSIKTN